MMNAELPAKIKFHNMKFRDCLAAALGVFLLSFHSAPVAAESAPIVPGVSCQIADDALRTASKIRRLAVLQKVPCHLQSKSEVETYLRQVITRDVPREKIDLEGHASRVIGLIPKAYNYYQGLVTLYTDQLAGYYEPEGHFYAMASWIPTTLQSSIAVHELTHALQDQHFNLTKFTDETELSNDELLARAALVEGDAMSVMIDFERLQHHFPPLQLLDGVDDIVATEIIGSLGSSRDAPRSLESLLMFPYLSGLRFVHSIIRRGGHAAVDSAFLIPPQSTEQILHPQQFAVRRERPGFEELPDEPADIPQFEKSEPAFTDTLGEFTISVLLSQWIPPGRAAGAAAGWGGDRLTYYEAEHGSFLLLWRTRWDSPEDAAEFYAAVGDGYEERFKEEIHLPHHVLIREPARSEFRNSEAGNIRILLEGRDVLIRFQSADEV